jgi:hypothetical protein
MPATGPGDARRSGPGSARATICGSAVPRGFPVPVVVPSDLLFMLVGFAIASYSIVANDALQTLGTFLSSNRERPWWVLWLFAMGILYAVLIYGWVANGGDTSFGRLERVPLPRPFTWVYLVPPLVLLLLTRRGIPVSTTFLILTIFAPENLGAMFAKSIIGYGVAFAAAIGLYMAIAEVVERRFLDTAHLPPPRAWVAAQWISTGFLWSQWLIQDLANIFVYAPRRLSVEWLVFALALMAALHAYTFKTHGGAIQQVVTSKTNTHDIRSATIVDFVFGLILLVFKEWSRIPMSTTWVFLGLLAGREIAMAVRLQARPLPDTFRLIGRDGLKVATGLAVSVALALGLPPLADALLRSAPGVPRPAAAQVAPAPVGHQPPVTLRPVQPDLFAAPNALVNALADVDGDGDLDLFVGFNGPPNRLYRNDGGAFADVAAEAGIADARATRAAAFGDWDGDGDPDLLVGFAPGGGPVLRLYRNDGGRFADATAPAGLAVDSGAVRQPAWVDVDDDGDLDLFVAFRDRPNMLLRNEGGRLRDVAAEVGLADARRSVGAVWADLDADGDLDVIVGNMDGDANGVFRNDGGRFTDVAEAWGLAWGGRTPREPSHGTVRPCLADVDGDGRLDVVTANYGPPGLFLAGADGWREAGAAWGIAVDGRYDSCALADVDHDGRLDLYLNGTVTQGRNWPDYLYRQAGGRFVDVLPEALAAVPADHGVQWHDLDGDGAADLALTGQGPHALFANVLPDSLTRRSLRVRVLDGRGRATRAGAEVRVYAAGTRRLLATGLVDAGSGYDAQSDAPVHLGLPEAGRVDVEVTWPAAGTRRVTRVEGVPVDGRRVVEVRAR